MYAIRSYYGSVILDSSYESVLQAYQEALAVQEAAELRKKANMESHIILENISDGIVAVDKDGIIRYCNKSATEMLQCQPDPAGVITSYSIHYTKLYEERPLRMLSPTIPTIVVSANRQIAKYS